MAARSLEGKVDMIYTSTDNNVVSAYESLYQVAKESKIPLIASDTSSVERGAVAALGVNYYELGRETGKIVVRILNGEKAGAIPVYTRKCWIYTLVQSMPKKKALLCHKRLSIKQKKW